MPTGQANADKLLFLLFFCSFYILQIVLQPHGLTKLFPLSFYHFDKPPYSLPARAMFITVFGTVHYVSELEILLFVIDVAVIAWNLFQLHLLQPGAA